MKFQILSAVDGWFSYSNGIALFWTGMLFNEHKDTLLKNKALSLYIPITMCFFLYFYPLKIEGFAYIDIFLYSTFFYILIYNIKYSSSITKFMCKYNFELYLIHHRVYIIMRPCIVSSHGSILQLILACIFMNFIVFYISFYVKKIADTISSMFLKNKSIVLR